MKVTRIAYSARLNSGKYTALREQARRLGRARSEVWQRYGSVNGVGSGLSDRYVRDSWLADGTHLRFGVLANAWKETVRDAMADIAANLASAKVEVRRAVACRVRDAAERKRMFVALGADRWAADPFLARQMRKHWKRGKNRTQFGKNINRRLAAWTKGVTAEALANVSQRRGSALVHVNAAYTSQTCHCCGIFGHRSGDRFHCTSCGVVWQADVNAAINILQRAGDCDITLHTPHHRVKQILQDRTDRHRTGLPVQDSSPATARRRANHPNRSAMSK